MPAISVVLTSFNQAKYINEAIDSVLKQSFTDFELIIWDDASTDNSWEIINSYTDSRIIKFLNNTTKRGVYGINKAILEVACGEYIAIHHSDDVWMLDKLEKQIDFLSNNHEYGAVFSNALAVSEEGCPLNDDLHFYSNIFEQENRTRHEWLNYFLCNGNALCHPSVLIRKKCYDDCGLYRYGFAQLGDFDMWVRLCLKHEIYVLPEKLIHFRVRDNGANASASTIASRSRINFEYYLIAKNYLTISSFSELVLIFPDAIKYKSDGKEVIAFVWSKILLDEANFVLSKILALELLFNIINDPGSAKKVSDMHDFNLLKFVELTGKYGIVNKCLADYEAEIKEHDLMSLELDTVRAERDELLVEQGHLYASLSWRITKPLRIIKNFFR